MLKAKILNVDFQGRHFTLEILIQHNLPSFIYLVNFHFKNYKYQAHKIFTYFYFFWFVEVSGVYLFVSRKRANLKVACHRVLRQSLSFAMCAFLSLLMAHMIFVLVQIKARLSFHIVQNISTGIVTQYSLLPIF